ncbi:MULTISPECIES: 3-isopropylmalate dehydratase large subunit [Micrococcaceae]|jgi:3-isopropylmalate/(R)-2-methylmalate dehydratase large subunit|uniref:3-isopropylmalate dehydratase large subunit n=1 Tax=Micrococcaceae TaxID=1268 RepID=UPI0020977915|nr:3-isopropylmalate dehydratase large subunit [Arthrobacter sp. H16F315]MDD1475382.1 3-isopropylmalate dehydratase large subunit [Arthrobacter sp. H16F315]
MTGTMFEKILDKHRVAGSGEVPDRLYVDLHLVHDLSPQAFAGLRSKGRSVRRTDLTLATADHGVSTRGLGGPGTALTNQLQALQGNCKDFGIPLYGMGSAGQGIVHVIAPELGLTQPGMVIACGDSHTPTHGALGALGFGIGTSDVEHVLATQCLVMPELKSMRVNLTGALPDGVTGKDLALALVAHFNAGDARGHVIEFQGEAVAQLTVEERLTLCNLSAEMGARAALISPDERTLAYLKGRRHAPKGDLWDQAVMEWMRTASDIDAVFDTEVDFDVSRCLPTVTWGTTPAMSVGVNGRVPHPEETNNPEAARRALLYMGLAGGEKISDIGIDVVFIGSCANGRLGDLRAAANVLEGRHIAQGVRGLVVPGSRAVKLAAEAEGLDRVFMEAGFEWREPGCSMCLGMNDDILGPGQRCAATSNRNFEGRQGPGGRTHLVSPRIAAATALSGRIADVERAA